MRKQQLTPCADSISHRLGASSVDFDVQFRSTFSAQIPGTSIGGSTRKDASSTNRDRNPSRISLRWSLLPHGRTREPEQQALVFRRCKAGQRCRPRIRLLPQ